MHTYEASWPGHPDFDPRNLDTALKDRTDRGEKVYTGAYIITAPPKKGQSKTHFTSFEVIGKLWADREKFNAYFRDTVLTSRRLAEVHRRFMAYPGWGPFLAYQAVVDLRFTDLLICGADVLNWCAAGPGTIRGLNRLYGRPVDKQIAQDQARRELVAMWPELIKATGVQMDLSDVPNVMCEVDKYLRVKNGEGTPRAKYVYGRGS